MLRSVNENAMKARFAAGEPAFGLSVMIPSPQIVESAAGMGFDWVLIDCEHGTVGLESMELMIMAAEAAGVTPIVRPRTNSASDILQAMDRGASGVQVPHINTAAEARAAVAAVKFHPQGQRSLAAGTRASGYGFRGSMAGFVHEANRRTLVCVQIEDTIAKIVAAGKTPGMPATAEAVQGVLAMGVRYIYTHLPVVLASGAKADFKVARPQA